MAGGPATLLGTGRILSPAMPELPEVEALCRSFDARLRGRVVARMSVRSVAVLKTFDPPATTIEGLAFDRCVRRGKFLDLAIPPLHLVVHLARGGWIRLRDKPTNARPSLRGPLAVIASLADGGSLEITEHGTDKRLAVSVVRDPGEVPGIARLGIDALDPELSPSRLGELLDGQHGTLKSVLADQAVIAGIGNAYSDEILHAAQLSPFRHADALTGEELDRLAASIRDVLSAAVALAVDSDPASLKDGKRQSMRVHGRTGLPCPVCGATVREVSLASRSFQYCPGCQTGGRVFADRRLSRLLR
jgi:formamidopyrimidine-DNA glycosylase